MQPQAQDHMSDRDIYQMGSDITNSTHTVAVSQTADTLPNAVMRYTLVCHSAAQLYRSHGCLAAFMR